MKEISIIIPTYERPHLLQRAIYSIHTNFVEKIEVIVCDDSENSNTISENKKIIELLCREKQFEIYYIRNSHNKGVSGARNCGIEKSKGSWIAFLDDDDEFTEEYLDYLLQEIRKNTQIDFYWSDIYLKQSYSRSLIRKKFFIRNNKDLISQIITIGISYGVCLRKTCFLNCNGFDETLQVGEDTDLILNLLSHCCRMQHIEQFGIIKHEDTDFMLSKNIQKYAKNHIVIKLLNKYSSLFANDITSYCGMIRRGQFIYLSNKMPITAFLFSFRCIIRYHKRILLIKKLLKS